jgi:hypothetical protein
MEDMSCKLIQEVGHEIGPTRMVDLLSLDLANPSKDAGPRFFNQHLRKVGIGK